MIRMLLAVVAVLTLTGLAPQNRYAVGQVWEYKNRPADEGSLLKIQRVEPFGPKGELVYHISVIGLRFRNHEVGTALPHTPVSRETLDASVTGPSRSRASFPDPSEGIAEWRSANGGMFTITVAEIIEIVDQQTAG